MAAQVLNVPASSMQDACDYMKIICCGTVFVFGYNAVCSIMKGRRFEKARFYFIAVATVVNILLDIILVGHFRHRTKGAAYATIFSPGHFRLLSLIHLKGKTYSNSG